ncbi:hypothetical protein C4577_01335 [Candidatus Parcubacteria bacterium]|nr:MAG: hypothetical protein C4577_01335 [Candidatus Parcubacteria bacterium]
MEQQVPPQEASEGQRTENLTQSLQTVLKDAETKDPEMVHLVNQALAGMIEYIVNAEPGTQTEEVKGTMEGMGMVFNRNDLDVSQGTAKDARRIAMFLQRVKNKAGTINDQGEAEVKVSLSPTSRSTKVNLPKQ